MTSTYDLLTQAQHTLTLLRTDNYTKLTYTKLTSCFSSAQLHHTDCMTRRLVQFHLYHQSFSYAGHLEPSFLTEAASLIAVPSHYHLSRGLASELHCHGHHHVTNLHHRCADIESSLTPVDCDCQQPTYNRHNSSLHVM